VGEGPYDGALPLPGPSIAGAVEEQAVAIGFPTEFRSGSYAVGPGAVGWSPMTPAGADTGGGSGPISHGLNVGVCRDISYGLTKDAEGLEQIAEAADGAVRRIVDVWEGEDGEQFRATWRRSRRAVDEATTSLRTMRRRLDAAVDEQEAASRR
jgi:uncharacterized protein YukE